jgi:hypothetical protein
MFSSSSYAGWTKVDETVDGHTFYVDFERIRKHDGYVYWWTLGNLLKPIKGLFSSKIYRQGDCKLLRYKDLSFIHHKQPMGRDTGESNNPENPKWEHPTPTSVSDIILKSVCNR